jgi:hypothetical protein
MLREINRLGVQSTNLQPDTTGKYPLNAANSIIHGEKSYHILLNLEKATSRGFMISFLNEWFDVYKSERACLNDVMHHLESALGFEYSYVQVWEIKKKVRFDLAAKRIEIPQSEISFSSSAINEIEDIVQEYIKRGGDSSPENFSKVKLYPGRRQLAFFEKLLASAQALNQKLVARIERDYFDLVYGNYDELKASWLLLTAITNYSQARQRIADFVGSTGVVEHIRPIYQALKQTGNADYALRLLNSYRSLYHPYVYGLIQNDLSN